MAASARAPSSSSSPSPSSHQTPVRVSDLPGRGRALVATRRILPGEVVLTDSPLLLYPSSLASLSSYCSCCFRSLSLSSTPSPFPLRCPSCSLALFCCSTRSPSPSPSLAHPILLCRALPLLFAYPASSLSPDLIPSLLFLLSAYSLPSPSLLRLLSLSAPAPPSSPEALTLHSLLSSLLPPDLLLPPSFSPDLTAALLARDKANAFALMAPSAAQSRGVRAYGIYADAAFFNHDCLPNACRFDYVDGPGDQNADITVRALHEIPEGREVCISYFPANWSYTERQRRLLEDYGFRCECDRCIVESRWKENGEGGDDDDDGGGEEERMEEEEEEEEGGEEEGEEEEMEEEENEDGEGGGDGNGDFPHAYFFVRFLCEQENCGGTLAPLPPSTDGTSSDVLECNVCGRLRKEEETGGDGDGDMLDE